MYSLKILLVPKILLEWRNYLRIMDIMASSYDHFYFPPSSYLLSSLGRFLWLSEKDKLKQLFFLLFKIDVILYYYGLKTNAKQYGTFLAFLNHFQLKYLVSINSIYKVKSWLPTGAAERAFFQWSTKNFPFHTSKMLNISL